MWNKFLLFCKQENYHFLKNTIAAQLNDIIKEWAANIKQVNGEDYKESVVMTMFNV